MSEFRDGVEVWRCASGLWYRCKACGDSLPLLCNTEYCDERCRKHGPTALRAAQQGQLFDRPSKAMSMSDRKKVTLA